MADGDPTSTTPAAARTPATAQSAAGRELDPTLVAVLAHRFEAIVREMTNTLFRAGRSSIINMARDFSCSIITAQDELFAAAEGLQVHVLGAGLQTRSMRELHPDLREGDAYLHNDPMLGNTHTADHTILVPVFVDGEHLFTASAKAHQADCGNAEPSTYVTYVEDVYAEGALVFPCVKVQQGYEDIDDVIRMCRRRIRVPEVWYGDYLAAVGSARIGERRVKEVVERYGIETIKAFVVEWLDYSERVMDQAIRKLPAKRLHASGKHDPIPGLPDGVEVNVTVDVKPDEGRVLFDLRENPDCIPFGLNVSEYCARGGCTIALLNCLQENVPRNAGSFRRVEVLLREGSIAGGLVEPYSASVSTTNVLNRIINAAQSAFCQLGEGQGLAEGAGAMGVGYAVFSGTYPSASGGAGGEPYVSEFVIGNNGGPGSPHCDGWITYAMPDCSKTIYIDSVEMLERTYPLQFRSLRLLADSGGAGRFRGGPASEVIYGPRATPMRVFYMADYARHPAAGVLGGLPGTVASAHEIAADGSERQVEAIGDSRLVPGEWIRGVEAGGGGYGDPLTRDPETVLADVLERWVTREAASDLYGVVLVEPSERGTGPALDASATEARRAELRALRNAASAS
ncbi:MAG TPA: hydantoinase B/oxoprolinase family protein [Solirubrobacteraceae bacterium]|jgi:N-methylhydantoinase B|nr:hydantoinase B/oxoprolinase family protein [Solirubrobacteraceae bacterium]